MTENGIAGANGAAGSGTAPSTVRELHLPEALELAKLAAVFEDLQYVLKCCEHLVSALGSPDAGPLRVASDDALDAWMLKTVGTARHISGTCKMGPAADPLAVVNQYCQVHGMQGLRVVDGSILPQVTRANTHATIIMAAERVAAWI